MTDAEKRPKVYRVKDPGAAAVYCQATGQYEVPNPVLDYPEGHYMVREHPWLFGLEGLSATPERRTAVKLETTRQRPGEKRRTRPEPPPEGMGRRADGAIRPREPQE